MQQRFRCDSCRSPSHYISQTESCRLRIIILLGLYHLKRRRGSFAVAWFLAEVDMFTGMDEWSRRCLASDIAGRWGRVAAAPLPGWTHCLCEMWARPDSNRGPPPCEGGVLTRLDDEPLYSEYIITLILLFRGNKRTL